MADQPVGRLRIPGSSLGEVTAVVLLSLLFSMGGGSAGGRLLLLGLLLVAAGVVLVVRGARHVMTIRALVDRLADTTASVLLYPAVAVHLLDGSRTPLTSPEPAEPAVQVASWHLQPFPSPQAERT